MVYCYWQSNETTNVSNGKCQICQKHSVFMRQLRRSLMMLIGRSDRTKEGSYITVSMLERDGYCECLTVVPINGMNVLALCFELNILAVARWKY